MALKYFYTCTCIHTNPSVLEMTCGSTVLSFDGSIVPDGALAVVCSIVDVLDVVPVDNDDDVDIDDIDADNSVGGDKSIDDDHGDDVDSCDENDVAAAVDGFVDFDVGVSDINVKSQR